MDGLPYLVTQALERIAAHRPGETDYAGVPLFLAIANCGFPEAQHNETALAICEQFAAAAGFRWAGGLALGEGGAINGQPLAKAGGMVHNVVAALDLAAAALAEGEPVPAEAIALMARPFIPAASLHADGRSRLADAGAAQSRLDPTGRAAVRTEVISPLDLTGLSSWDNIGLILYGISIL